MNLMKVPNLTLVAAFCALALPSCLQNETTVHLNKDGSGTVVEKTTIGAQMQTMLQQFAQFGGGDVGAKDPVAEMFSPEKGKAKAASMGEGVSFERSEPIEVGQNRGAITTYRFADINKLAISPTDAVKSASPMADQMPPTPKGRPVTFNYAAGKLTINTPAAPEPQAEDSGAPDLEENPQMEQMMKEMLGDMKMSLKLVVESGIAETDATHRDGNTILLADLEMGKVLANPEALKKMTAAGKNDPAASFEALRGIEGVKFESKEQVTVQVK
jgi:type IV secretory pathway VirB10-like protein